MKPADDTDRFVDAFNRISNVFASIGDFPDGINLSKLELLTLEAISRQQGLIMTELARGLGIRLSTATGIIDRLVEKGLVERSRNGGDRRVVRLKLTDKGNEIASAYQEQMKGIFGKMMAVLSAQERENLVSVIEKIASQIGQPTRD